MRRNFKTKYSFPFLYRLVKVRAVEIAIHFLLLHYFKKTISIAVLSFFLVTSLSGQPFDVGALRKKIKLSDEDSTRVLLLGRLSTYYNHNHLDSGFFLARQMISLSRKLKYPYGEAWGLSILSTSADRTGDMTKSLEIALSGLRIAETLSYGHEEMSARAYTQLGVVNFLTGHYPESRSYLHKALSYAGSFYGDEKKYYVIYAHLANAFRREGLLDSALYYTQKAYYLSLTSSEVFFFPYVRNCEGDINQALGKQKEAKQFYHDAIVQGIKVNHLFQLSYSFSQLSDIFFKSGELDSCVYFAKKSLALSQAFFYGTFIPQASNQMALAYEKLHQPDSALKYLKYSMEVKDKVMSQTKQQQFQLLEFEELQRQEKITRAQQQYSARIRNMLLISGLAVLLLISTLLYRNNRIKQKSNKLLQIKALEIEKAMQSLRETQSQLIQSEKMASLGELTAGIAHEIQNPLNFVNNFSEVNKDLLMEMKEEMESGNFNNAKTIANDVISNEEKINHHGKRADAIIKGMLQHSQTNNDAKEPTDVNGLVNEYAKLAFHAFRGKDRQDSSNSHQSTTQFGPEVNLQIDLDPSISKIKLAPQEIGRVLLNVLNNAFYAVKEKQEREQKKKELEKEEEKQEQKTEIRRDVMHDVPEKYQPQVSVSTKKKGNQIEITVKDNGIGIPHTIADKIFQPFFTTKPTGQGTGLGLSLSYDILKAHGAEIKVTGTEGQGSEFLIILNANS